MSRKLSPHCIRLDNPELSSQPQNKIQPQNSSGVGTSTPECSGVRGSTAHPCSRGLLCKEKQFGMLTNGVYPIPDIINSYNCDENSSTSVLLGGMFNNSIRFCTGMLPKSGADTMIRMSEPGKFTSATFCASPLYPAFRETQML